MLSNHISNEQINGFMEDRFGQMWISTFRGLNKYDGNTFHQYYCICVKKPVKPLVVIGKERIFVYRNTILKHENSTSPSVTDTVTGLACVFPQLRQCQ